MTLSEFFESEKIALPIGGFKEGDQTFDEFAANYFARYLDLLKTIADPEHPGICSEIQRSLPETKSLCRTIVKALKRYLRGSPSDAYGEIETALNKFPVGKMITALTGFVAGNTLSGDGLLDSLLHPPLYRMRSSKEASVLSRKDLFHVPFEKRHRVHNQRFSIAGLPCLYLGSSTWVCWEELGRPELDSIFVSRFQIAEEVRVLDFSFPPQVAWRVYNYAKDERLTLLYPIAMQELRSRYDDRFVAVYIASWPLIAACSVRRESKEVGAFFPQYIVPQLLLQWVTKDQRVDGIRYFSTKTPPGADPHTNCAFPAREIAASGRCSHLRRKFHLTDPIAWSILREIDTTTNIFIGPSNHARSIKLTDSVNYHYLRTGFFEVEVTLLSIEGMPNASGAVEA